MFLSNVGYDFGCGTKGSGSILTLRWVSIFLPYKVSQKPPSLSRRLVRIWAWKSSFRGVSQILLLPKSCNKPYLEIYQEESPVNKVKKGPFKKFKKKKKKRRNRRRWWKPHNHIIKILIGCKKKFLFQILFSVTCIDFYFYHKKFQLNLCSFK
jgi:hypothetical protein